MVKTDMVIGQIPSTVTASSLSSALPRIAVVGAKRGGAVTREWQRFGLARLVALCDLDPGTLAAEADKTEADGSGRPAVFTELQRMLEWKGMDAVFVSTPDATHYRIARQVMEAGFHCYIEKPMATTVEDAASLVDVWRQTGVIGVVGQQARHLDAVVFAHGKIASGAIGKPCVAATMDACGRMGCYWRRAQWRAGRRDPENTLTLQKSIHQLDLQTHLMGSRAARVYASAGRAVFGGDRAPDLMCDACPDRDTCKFEITRARINGRDFPKGRSLCVFAKDADLHDHVTAVIEYENGTRGSYVECFFTPDYMFEQVIIGSEGRLVIREYYENPYLDVELSWIGSTTTETHRISGVGGHGGADYRIGKAFTGALTAGRQMSPTLEDGFFAVALAKAVDASVETGMPQPVAGLTLSGGAGK